jgi:hypothetical protein
MVRTKKKIHYLYKTTCLITSRYYIGMHSTCNLNDGYMGSGKRLRYSIKKYGPENHNKEILGFFENRDLLIEAEKKAITPEMLTDKNCMNLKYGGYGGLYGLPKQVIIKISKAGNKAFKEKLQTDVDFKKQHSEKMSKAIKKAYEDGKIDKSINYDWSGKNHTIETKDKISNTKKGSGIGETNSQYGTCWVNKSGTNKKVKKEIIDNYLNEGWTIGRKTEINGEKIKTSKLKEVDVKEIKRLLSIGELSQIKIAKLFGVHQETISKIKRNLIWVNVTYDL